MNRLAIRSLLALNILTLIFACVVILVGKKCLDIQQSTTAPTSQDFENRLATKIGQPYTSKTHSTVSELFHTSFEESKDIFAVLHSYGDIGIRLGVGLSIASAISLFILSRALLNRSKEAEQAGDGDAEEAV